MLTRGVNILLLFVLCVELVRSHTHGELPRIAGYEPETEVSDENNVDLDLQQIKIQLALLSVDGHDAAMAIYEQGAFSAPYAKLTVDPLTSGLFEGDIVSGLTESFEEVKATVIMGYPQGSEIIRVKYHANDCLVGANPDPLTNGCFAESGRLVVAGVSQNINYTYSILEDNLNEISFQKLSADKKYATTYWCKNCNSADFTAFFKYYGIYGYAHEFVRAATSGTKTDFDNGDADFSKFGEVGRNEAFAMGVLVLHIWMEIIFLMEDAVGKCSDPFTPDEPISSWDRAVAYYTGSLEGESSGGMDSGVMQKALANKFCKIFKTCGMRHDSVTGEAFVNTEILRLFKGGKNELIDGYSCSGARKSKSSIRNMMLVPLIQGALLNGYLQYTLDDDFERDESAGATFAAAILPLIDSCSPEDAKTVHSLLATEKRGTDFPKLKATLERNYRCLEVSCKHIGGIWDSVSGNYYPDSNPCVDSFFDIGKDYALSIALGVAGGILLLVAAIFYCAFGRDDSLRETMELADLTLEAEDDPGEDLPEFT